MCLVHIGKCVHVYQLDGVRPPLPERVSLQICVFGVSRSESVVVVVGTNQNTVVIDIEGATAGGLWFRWGSALQEVTFVRAVKGSLSAMYAVVLNFNGDDLYVHE